LSNSPIIWQAEGVEIGDDTLDGVLGLCDGDVRVVLTLSFEALVMLEELFAEEISETRT
jgi:hypothetical protein